MSSYKVTILGKNLSRIVDDATLAEIQQLDSSRSKSIISVEELP